MSLVILLCSGKGGHLNISYTSKSLLYLQVGFRTCDTLGFFVNPSGGYSLENPKGDSETFRESDQS